MAAMMWMFCLDKTSILGGGCTTLLRARWMLCMAGSCQRASLRQKQTPASRSRGKSLSSPPGEAFPLPC